MEINELKKSIKKRLDGCQDEELLLDMPLQLLGPPPRHASEPETEYISKSIYQLPAWKLKQLEEDHEKLIEGKLELSSWSDVKKSLQEKHDF